MRSHLLPKYDPSLTNAVDRYIVGDRFHDGPKTSGHKKATYNIDLCPELVSFQSITSEVLKSKIKSTRLQSSNQQNLHHYFFYNRLMDCWSNFISNGCRCIREPNQEKLWLEMFHRLLCVYQVPQVWTLEANCLQ